ncbi:hypothetical protein EG329_010736 [Mollisiaceae sp. DMI_Dod_QoI]|nr:hypothetical protein EG329_010736 [Helotiales sp. DMI_Dod_QoI]
MRGQSQPFPVELLLPFGKLRLVDMASRGIPPKPWLHQQNHSSSSLVSRGMEVGVPPGEEPPSPNQYRESRLSTSDDRYRTWNRVSNTIAAQQRAASPTPVSGWSQSSKKVQQLTGYDLGNEKAFPQKYKQSANQVTSSAASDSDGSVYSQPESDINNTDTWNLTSTQIDHNQRPGDQQRAHTLSKLQQNVAPSAEDIITLQQILTEQQRRYEEELQKEMRPLVPKPLAIRSKKPKRISILSSAPSMLRNARDSLEWGINELTSPKPKKHNNTPVKARFSMHSGNTTPEEMPPTPPPKSSRRKKKKFGAGEHPLRSPYPFPGKEEDDVLPSPSESSFGSKFSGAVRGLSTSRRGSQTKKTVITNRARKADGPDTPLPLKSGFVETIHRGNEQLQEIIEKTKKNVLRTAEERRRDELKKKIVVVGIGDQSPGSYP